MTAEWCRCKKCGHKLFKYEPDMIDGDMHIGIKCSSCKSLLDVFVINGEVKVVESE